MNRKYTVISTPMVARRTPQEVCWDGSSRLGGCFFFFGGGASWKSKTAATGGGLAGTAGTAGRLGEPPAVNASPHGQAMTRPASSGGTASVLPQRGHVSVEPVTIFATGGW